MPSLPTLECGTFTNIANTAIVGTNPVLENIAGTDDADYVYTSQNATGTKTAEFTLSDMPSDFSTMATLSVQFRSAVQTGSQVNTWNGIIVEVRKSAAEGSGLLGTTSLLGPNTSTTPTNSNIFGLGSLDTSATKDSWNNGVVLILFSITR